MPLEEVPGLLPPEEAGLPLPHEAGFPFHVVRCCASIFDLQYCVWLNLSSFLNGVARYRHEPWILWTSPLCVLHRSLHERFPCGHVPIPCLNLFFGPIGLICSRVVDVFILIVIIIWAASVRLWLLQTLRLRCAVAGRRSRGRGVCLLLMQATGGGVQALAATGRLLELLEL